MYFPNRLSEYMRFNEGILNRYPIPASDGPIYKGEFPNICSYFPGSYFPTVIDSTPVVWRL
jgi:hypothetical protein